MEINKWSFQLLLEVFANYLNSTPGDKIVSPIITNMFIRDETSQFEFPFEFTYLESDWANEQRYTADGVFKQNEDCVELHVNFFEDPCSMTHNDIMSIITFDKLSRC